MSRSHVSGAGAGAGAGDGPTRPQSSTAAYAPLSPKDLARSAEMFEWRPQIPLKFHIGSLDAMYREGKTYLAERNYAKAYVLLMRFSIICVEKVSTHPEAHTPEGKRLVRTATRRLKTVMELLESIKTELVVARQRWADASRAKAATADTRESAHDRRSFSNTFAAQDPALSWNPHTQAELIDASEHVELAIALANKRVGDTHELGERASERLDDAAPQESNDVSRDMERARWRLDGITHPRPSSDDECRSREDRIDPVVPVSYNYPSIHRSAPVSYEPTQLDARGTRSSSSAARPPLPPKQSNREPVATASSPVPPPIPSRDTPLASRRYNNDLLMLQQKESSLTTTASVPPLPPPKTLDIAIADTPLRPAKSQYTFKPAAYLESGAPIRSVFLPDTLRSDFLRVARPNTDNGIETCGILCGKTANNALFITCLLIPQQIGTRDSCETTGEVATLEYCSEHDLIQIGWIHTHPTQTCFMSSLDMHTHAGYQIMMDESIAIVCAPTHEPSWGIFRLTNPPGLPYIGGCRKAGAFHEHDLKPHEIYTEAKNPPGHVFVVPGIDYTVADLRDKA
ncbi:hypothetical protein SEPCBS57363_004649 [Sporothrix epigloea]|uniref:MPN domain-containing protein n=1 Tax=Sporothrix epigloea TaxID=1892477 RepID=A0ABP0DX48_9PEZI